MSLGWRTWYKDHAWSEDRPFILQHQMVGLDQLRGLFQP